MDHVLQLRTNSKNMVTTQRKKLVPMKDTLPRTHQSPTRAIITSTPTTQANSNGDKKSASLNEKTEEQCISLAQYLTPTFITVIIVCFHLSWNHFPNTV